MLTGLVLVFILCKLYVRLQLSLAKHRSLAGHSRMARRFASWVPFYEYDEANFFGVDRRTKPQSPMCVRTFRIWASVRNRSFLLACS